jgi:uncharacterized membrane protein YgdD (TMEM256/DUF423 family)
MWNASFYVVAGALSAASSVALGAFGAHALKSQASSPYFVDIWSTGAQYHLVHSIALMTVPAVLQSVTLKHRLKLSPMPGRLFLGGCVLFSGSLYALAYTENKKFGAITPLGGLCFIGGWLSLASQAYTNSSV